MINSNYIHLFLLTAMLMIATNHSAFAQAGGHAGEFSRLGFSPRGMAMGNALSSVVSEGSYGYYNPAHSAARNDYTLLALSTASMRFDRNLHMAASHIQLPPSAGISFSLMNARVGDIDGRTTSGYHTETLSTSEIQMSGSFGIRFSENFWGGLGISYNLASYHTEIPNTSTIGIDAGILARLTPSITISGVIKDLLASYDFDTSSLYNTDRRTDTDFSFPTRVIGGASVTLTEKWLLSSDAEFRFQSFQTGQIILEDDEFGSRERLITENGNNISTFLRMGARHHLHERLTIRGGVQLGDPGNENTLQPSAGFSLHLPYDRFAPSIDYAFIREPSQLSTMHVFAITLQL